MYIDVIKSAFCQRVPTVKNVRLSLRIEISIVSISVSLEDVDVAMLCRASSVLSGSLFCFCAGWCGNVFLCCKMRKSWPDAKDGHPEKARHHFYLRQMLCWCQKRYTPQSRSSFRRVKVAFLPARKFWNTLCWFTLGTFGRKRVKH